jgi:hypothetical protein
MGFFTGLWKDWGKGKMAGPKTDKEVKKVAKKAVKKVKKTTKKK